MLDTKHLRAGELLTCVTFSPPGAGHAVPDLVDPCTELALLLLLSCFASGLAAQRLLKGLAIACPHLEELHVLPLPRSGLGDEEVPLLNKLTGLKVGVCDA